MFEVEQDGNNIQLGSLNFTINLEERILNEQENTAFLYLDGNRGAYCEYSPLDGTTALNVNVGIKNIKTCEVLFTKEDVNCFDNQFIYATTIKEEHTKYRQYTLDGKLMKEIVPSVSCESEEENIHSVYVWKSDFTTICRIIRNEILSYSMNGYILCNVESGKCRYL